MTDPRITVAMSVYNNAPYLRLAIESILAQSFADFEFLIVNDGSSDGSAEIIDSFAAANPRVRAIHQPNSGLIASLNRMVADARAPLIARMDGDDIAMPGRFAAQLAYMDAHPETGVLGTGANCIDEAGRSIGHRFDNVTDPDALVADLKNGPPICHSSVMMRRDVVRTVGGYHAAYRHCEDYDLWLRLSERTQMANLADRLILYRLSAGQVSSRHALVQQTGAAIAWVAHEERLAGRPDPTEGLAALPPIDGLDALFGRDGVSRAVRAKVAHNIVYSSTALKGDGLDLLLEHIADGGSRDQLWRTTVRLLTFGEPLRAARLALALARA